MKRFLKIVGILALLFILLSLCYDKAIVWLIYNSPSNNTMKMAQIARGGDGESLAIFGSSRALSNYVPSLLSDSAFNYGVNGMSINEALRLLKLYLMANQSKSTIVINLDPWGFAKPGTEILQGDYRLAGDIAAVREEFKDIDLGWLGMLPGVRFQGELRSILGEYLNARKNVTKKIDNGAEILLKSRTDAEWDAIEARLSPIGFNFFNGNEKLLDEIYQLRGEHRIVWVVSPLSPAMRDKFTGGDALAQFLTYESTRDGVFSVSLIDWKDEFPRNMFVDVSHLNIWGAEKFSRAVRKEMDDMSEWGYK